MNVKFPNNTSKWQMEFNSEFKGLTEESESKYTSKEEEILESPPTDAQMREALQIFVVVCNIKEHTSKGIMSTGT
jgi:hypothetical protein